MSITADSSLVRNKRQLRRQASSDLSRFENKWGKCVRLVSAEWLF